MLDGATDEDPFSILSVSIEHPLQVGSKSGGDRRKESGKWKVERGKWKEERKEKRGKRKEEG